MKKNLFVVFLLLSFNTILACDCLYTLLPKTYHKANIVAEITVLNIYGNDTKDRTYKAEVKFEKFFKGKTDKTTLNLSGNIGRIDGSACDVEFKKGEKYIIFLNHDNEEISSCTPHYLLNRDNSYHSKISAAENLFAYLKNNTIQNDNFIFYFEKNKTGRSSISKLKNFKPKNNFAVYEIIFTDKNSIASVNIKSEFGDRDDVIAELIKKNIYHPFAASEGKRSLITFVYIPEYVSINYRDYITSELN
ncbi:hypothetical protein [Chryseobacterium caseinilyticum]|uniref:Tissue inhibitor of metalloproteinase n=1 Tax=Chryseobacterium caseinilyticum TaxID=2771428 RepID=A0ABR8ZA31_9FLAO|nr:hypothetical protein [Chryseobacterium caseinilyticum]MBD8082102.1 hypothetical protein [Chryseobacterium caseinilyticum]